MYDLFIYSTLNTRFSTLNVSLNTRIALVIFPIAELFRDISYYVDKYCCISHAGNDINILIANVLPTYGAI